MLVLHDTQRFREVRIIGHDNCCLEIVFPGIIDKVNGDIDIRALFFIFPDCTDRRWRVHILQIHLVAEKVSVLDRHQRTRSLEGP